MLLGAAALPAFASPGDWQRFQIGDATQAEAEILPMPFEQPGSSFPGSAFYYLAADETGTGPIVAGIRSDAPDPEAGRASDAVALSDAYRQ